MQINDIDCSPETERKILLKHHLEMADVEEVFINNPVINFLENGHTLGEDVYSALGQNDGGTYIRVIFIYKNNGLAWVITAYAV